MNDSTRAVVRTVLQVLAGLAVAVPVVVGELGLSPTIRWVAVALAVSALVTRAMQSPVVDVWLTQLGIGKVGRHVAGRDEDAGHARPLALAAVASVVLLLVSSSAAVAHRRERPGPLYVGVWSARQCTGVLEVGYGTERLHGGVWGIVPDSWGAEVQLHYIGNGAAPGGQWETVPGIHRTEGHVAAVVSGLPTWDSVRVVVGEDGGAVVASSGRTPEGCPE